MKPIMDAGEATQGGGDAREGPKARSHGRNRTTAAVATVRARRLAAVTSRHLEHLAARPMRTLGPGRARDGCAAHPRTRARARGRVGDCTRILGRSLFHLYLFPTASRMVLPNIVVLARARLHLSHGDGVGVHHPGERTSSAASSNTTLGNIPPSVRF